MAEQKLFAGHAVRRLRRGAGLTQAAMAEMLGISGSYLNLVERNQRPISATLMLKLADVFDFDPRSLAAAEPGGGAAAMRRRLGDPLFADLEIDRSEVEEWLAAAPGGAEAFARAYDRLGGAPAQDAPAAPSAAGMVRRAIERWRNHFPDLDSAAEALNDELRLAADDLYAAMAERLRVRHHWSVRVLPVEVLPDRLRRLDYHARQIQLSEMLTPASRGFALAQQLGASEAREEIDGLVRGAELTDRVAERLFRRHLAGYFAAAVMMPYARFLRACETSGYDFELLCRRFGASHEQVAHRLTTMQRVGARGLPFFMLRVDRAGQVSKRYAGASGADLVEAPGLCPLWDVFGSFAMADRWVPQLVSMENGGRWFTLSRAIEPPGARVSAAHARFAVAVGLAASEAGALAAARGFDLEGRGMPIGPGCPACTRTDCPQRSAPPAARAMVVNDRETGLTPFTFRED